MKLFDYLSNNPQIVNNGFLAAHIPQSIDAGKPVLQDVLLSDNEDDDYEDSEEDSYEEGSEEDSYEEGVKKRAVMSMLKIVVMKMVFTFTRENQQVY